MNNDCSALLCRSGLKQVIVRGRSMEPALIQGQTVTIEEKKAGFGDIVVFVRNGVCFVHRVGFRLGRTYITVGDNAVVPDPPVDKGAIIGVAAKNCGFLKPVKGFLKVVKHYFVRVIKQLASSV